MAQLPAIKRFSLEDYPSEVQKWIGTLFFPLNLLVTTLYSALNNGLTLTQNIQSQVVTLAVTGASPTTSFPYKYSPNVPIGVTVINVVQTDTPAVTLTASVGCLWTINKGAVSVTLQGLHSGSKYNVTFVVWGG